MPAELVIKDLHATVEGKPILQGVNLTIRQGEVHALMGPNGSGKSTLAYTIAGHPHYEVTGGDILLDGRSILGLAPDERAKAGLFLAFQYPTAIPGVSMANFLRQAVSAVRGYTERAKQSVTDGGSAKPIGSELIPMREFRKELTDKMDEAARRCRFRPPLSERWLLRRRKETRRDPADGHARTQDRRAGRDRLGPGHRRPAGGRRGRQQPDRPGHGRAADHALPAAAGLHQAAITCTSSTTAASCCPAAPRWRWSWKRRGTIGSSRSSADEGVMRSAYSVIANNSHLPLSTTQYEIRNTEYQEQTMAATDTDRQTLENVKDEYKYGWSQPENYVFKSRKGLDHDIVEQISVMKGEPEWMRQLRHEALDIFLSKPIPTWGADLSAIDYQDIYYYIKPVESQSKSWDDVPADIKETFDKLGIPEAERKFLAGVGAQYESEAVYHSLKEEWEKQGVIFVDSDTGLREHPEIYKEYFGTVVPSTDNVFAALNTACWSGGSFVYVPKGVHLDIPLQAYFRINAQSMGQFERTLIIVDEGASIHYVEGCTAPSYSQDSLHSGVIEIIVRKGARCRYTTIQNWSTNVYNLVTQRSLVYEGATMEWVDANLGSKVTMKYPSVYMLGEGAHGQILSMAFAGRGQHLDTGGKLVHAAPNTSSQLISKSISKDGGRASYRGLLKVAKGAHGAKSNVVCDALLLDEKSRSDTYPYIEIDEDDVTVGHEASVSKIGEEQLFYLQSRGLSEDEASAMIVAGFIEPMVKELPMEYAVEMNRLIQLQMEGSIG